MTPIHQVNDVTLLYRVIHKFFPSVKELISEAMWNIVLVIPVILIIIIIIIIIIIMHALRQEVDFCDV